MSKSAKPGVIQSIVQFLSSSKKPLTREQIVKKLAARFKDREAEKMAATVRVQVPTRLAASGVKIEGDIVSGFIVKAR